ncbi:uncharacterized protein LOC103313889 [Tribolium castaneum]|uniref:EGF-like domain-containing protein n=1 Tax=Tribolium castaneum TaxID=7070 RepID=D6WSU5_TRICA|nr:PREDICTED: uncharacterized protein LOC103313889 [Tribolium castaneum]EFA06659.2 hypothetical protein TcasGA2_TC009585 [Tribolium castaneum]|eukprot:XP_008196569.1 PREDICTED: uncharacterized protein LOC103313889 [Tribolium castaneum]
MYGLKASKGLFFILLFNSALGESCDPTALPSQCPDSQLCDEATRTCQCAPGFTRNASACAPLAPTTPNTSSLVAGHHSGPIVAGILIPLVLILLVIYAIYISRKYKLVTWLQRKIHQRNNNYDEFMIGQEDDDPPLR